MLSRLLSLVSKLSPPQVATDSSPGHMYSLMRHQALSYDKEQLAALAPFPEPEPDEPAWGTVMEFAYPGFSATVAAFSNGQTNLYKSGGLGILNDGNNNLRQANANLIAAANKAMPQLKSRAHYAIPAPWQAVFYVRTDSGNLGAEAAAADFRNENHPLFSLFTAGNEVLSELNLLKVAQRKANVLQRLGWHNDAIAKNPADGEQYALRAEDYAELGDFDKALADFEKVVSLLPIADAVLGRGCMYMKMGDLNTALSNFDRAIEMEPANAMAYSNRGAAYSKLEEMEKALANYDLAIKNNPEYATAYANRAFAYYKLGRYQEALADSNRALELKPDFAGAYSDRGLCLAALGDKEGARTDFQRALKQTAPPSVIEEALSGLYALDYPGEPLPVWLEVLKD